MTTTHNRNFGLDLMRCIAILFVLLAHTLPILGSNHYIKLVSSIMSFCGVEFFFVLSGFLIGTILIKTHNKESNTTLKNMRVFWIRRWFRTLPNYYLMMVVYVGMYFFSKHVIFNFSKYVFFLQNLSTEMPNTFFGVSWSLAVEEWFYLLFPLILILIQFIFKNKKTSFLVTVLIFIAFPLCIRSFLALNGNNIAWDAGFRKIVLLRLDGIGVGVLASFINFYFNKFWDTYKKVFFLSGIPIIIMLMIVFNNDFINHYDAQSDRQLTDMGFFLKTFFFTSFSFGVALMLPFIYSIKLTSYKNILFVFVNNISLISYSLYLLHPVIINSVKHYLHNFNPYIIFSIIWVLSIFGAYIQYRFFEIKATALREKYGSGKFAVTV